MAAETVAPRNLVPTAFVPMRIDNNTKLPQYYHYIAEYQYFTDDETCKLAGHMYHVIITSQYSNVTFVSHIG